MSEEITKTNPLGISSIKEAMSVPIGQTIGDYFKRIFTYDWIFTGWEKIIVLAMMVWSLYSVYKFASGFF